MAYTKSEICLLLAENKMQSIYLAKLTHVHILLSKELESEEVKGEKNKDCEDEDHKGSVKLVLD